MKVGRLLIALASTTRRYQNGFICRATWKRHMQHLWVKLEAELENAGAL